MCVCVGAYVYTCVRVVRMCVWCVLHPTDGSCFDERICCGHVDLEMVRIALVVSRYACDRGLCRPSIVHGQR